MNPDVDVSEAVALYLKNYPGSNHAEFAAFYGDVNSTAARSEVQKLLKETMGFRPDWSTLSFNAAGDFVEKEMHTRHPDLTVKALECLGNFFTYLMR